MLVLSMSLRVNSQTAVMCCAECTQAAQHGREKVNKRGRGGVEHIAIQRGVHHFSFFLKNIKEKWIPMEYPCCSVSAGCVIRQFIA